jgi:hypothetical protein
LGLEVVNIRINKDENGKTGVSRGSLSFIEQVACCFAGDVAQDIWHPCADWTGSNDLQLFLRLAQGLSQEHREALEKVGCELARELLDKNKPQVVIVAQRLVQQGYMTATEFKHLTETRPLLK